jgi:hypothetical protein
MASMITSLTPAWRRSAMSLAVRSNVAFDA